MTQQPRTGSRSERHQRKRFGGRRGGARATARGAGRRSDHRSGRRPRRSLLAVGAVTVVVALLGVAAAVVGVNLYRDRAEETPAPAVSQQRTQRTLLLQIPAPDGQALASVLLATDPAVGSASMILLPSRVVSQLPGHGSGPFGEALKFGGPQLSKDTLSNQLGVIVDDSWVLERPGIVGLVDAVGGIVVEVDVEVPGAQSSDAGLRPGVQHLDGAAAAAYATHGVAGQPELGRLTRLQVVLGGVLDKLAAAPAVLSPAAGAGGLPPAQVREALALLAEARRLQKLSYKALPVTDIDNGSDEETTRVDPEQLAALVAAELSASVPPNSYRPDNRVVVRNGVGTPGVGQSVTRRLNAAGFVVVQDANLPPFDVPRSQVLIFDTGDEAAALGDEVAAALGLPEDAVEISGEQQSVAEVIVTVGADYAAVPASGSATAGVRP